MKNKFNSMHDYKMTLHFSDDELGKNSNLVID